MEEAKIRRNFQTWVAQLVDDDLSRRADRVVEMAKQIVHVGQPPDPHPGRLRDSIHKEKFPNPRVPGYRIIADAKEDGQENSYAYGVEMGHRKRSSLAPPPEPPDDGSEIPEAPEPSSPGYTTPFPYLVPALEAAKDQ